MSVFFGIIAQLSQVSLTLYLLGVKKELNGVNSATLHEIKRTFDYLRMRFKRKSIVQSEAVTPFYFMKLTPGYYLRNFRLFCPIFVNDKFPCGILIVEVDFDVRLHIGLIGF